MARVSSSVIFVHCMYLEEEVKKVKKNSEQGEWFVSLLEGVCACVCVFV